MVTFTSQAAASFALESFEEKPEIFSLEGKPETGAGGRAGLDGVSSHASPREQASRCGSRS